MNIINSQVMASSTSKASKYFIKQLKAVNGKDNTTNECYFQYGDYRFCMEGSFSSWDFANGGKHLHIIWSIKKKSGLRATMCDKDTRRFSEVVYTYKSDFKWSEADYSLDVEMAMETYVEQFVQFLFSYDDETGEFGYIRPADLVVNIDLSESTEADSADSETPEAKIDLSDDIYKQVAEKIAAGYYNCDGETDSLCSMKSYWMDGDEEYMDRCVAVVLGTDVDYVWENVNVDYDRLWDEAYEAYTTGAMDFIDGELRVKLHGGIEYTYTFEADGGIRFCCTYTGEDKTFMIGEYGAIIYTLDELMVEVENVNDAADGIKSLGYDLDSEVDEVCADYGVEMANRLVDESEDGYGDLGGDEGEGYIKYDRDALEREVRWNRSDSDDIAAYYNEDDAVERINDDNVLYAIEGRMKAYHPGLNFYCYINDTGDITMTWKPVVVESNDGNKVANMAC